MTTQPFLLCALCVSVLGSVGSAQDRVVTAGQDGVAAPKRTRTVNPVYPQEALAQGIRGIVILEVMIDPQGKVTSAAIIRSIPGLDEAALEAVRKWEYEITKVDGKPVSVKLTVPITFAMKVPEVTRAPGIPELRQGAAIQYPPGQNEGAAVTAEVTLTPEGQVADAEVLKGDAPWTAAVLSALRTWRFAPSGENVVLSFRVEAEFMPTRGDKPRVEVRLTGLRHSETASTAPEEPPSSGPEPTAAPPEPAAPSEPSAGAPAAMKPADPASTVSSPPVAPVGAGPAAPVPAPAPEPGKATPPAAAPPPVLPATTSGAAAQPPAGPPAPAPVVPSAPTSPEAKPAAAPPPVEVISAPRPPGADTPPPPPQPGVSAIKDVALALGVPDLVRGRRPVPPPLARMSGTTGSVEVKFGVDAAGVTSVSEASGPDVLKTAATYTVQSWFFRRVTAERLRLVVVFDFAGETAKAAVRPE